jgi:hypothetical protein
VLLVKGVADPCVSPGGSRRLFTSKVAAHAVRRHAPGLPPIREVTLLVSDSAPGIPLVKEVVVLVATSSVPHRRVMSGIAMCRRVPGPLPVKEVTLLATFELGLSQVSGTVFPDTASSLSQTGLMRFNSSLPECIIALGTPSGEGVASPGGGL